MHERLARIQQLKSYLEFPKFWHSIWSPLMGCDISTLCTELLYLRKLCGGTRNGVELGEGYAEIAASLKDKKP